MPIRCQNRLLNLAAIFVLLYSGCSWVGNRHTGTLVGHSADSLAAQASFMRWNLAATCSDSDKLSRGSRALELASHSNSELDRLMTSRSAPEVAMLHGKWNGVNKGIGAAAIGLTQDVKVFVTDDDCPRGYNQAVYQVGIDDLCSRGFQSKLDRETCQPKTMGNFVIVPACSVCKPLVLDYTKAQNEPHDPSRRLVDELVMIDQDLLLGKAHIKFKERLIPVAYFVLSRQQSQACDE